MSAELRVDRLVKRFATGRPAVDDVSFRVAAGEIVVLLGPSGCGKTTTLRMVAGFEEPDAGVEGASGREGAGEQHVPGLQFRGLDADEVQGGAGAPGPAEQQHDEDDEDHVAQGVGQQQRAGQQGESRAVGHDGRHGGAPADQPDGRGGHHGVPGALPPGGGTAGRRVQQQGEQGQQREAEEADVGRRRERHGRAARRPRPVGLAGAPAGTGCRQQDPGRAQPGVPAAAGVPGRRQAGHPGRRHLGDVGHQLRAHRRE